MAFIYAYGQEEVRWAPPNSDFSKGDVLEYVVGASVSSLSGYDPAAGSAAPIAGIALCKSSESYRGRVPYLVANDDTVFLADMPTGIDYAEGEERDIDLVSGDYIVADSTATDKVVVVRGTDSLKHNFQNSESSKVYVRLLTGDGEIEEV